MLVMVVLLNVAAIWFLVLTGNKKNIESRTEREEKILKKKSK